MCQSEKLFMKKILQRSRTLGLFTVAIFGPAHFQLIFDFIFESFSLFGSKMIIKWNQKWTQKWLPWMFRNANFWKMKKKCILPTSGSPRHIQTPLKTLCENYFCTKSITKAQCWHIYFQDLIELWTMCITYKINIFLYTITTYKNNDKRKAASQSPPTPHLCQLHHHAHSDAGYRGWHHHYTCNHPTSSCLWGWGWVVCQLSSFVVPRAVEGHRHHPTCDPPHKQSLVRLGQVVVGWLGSLLACRAGCGWVDVLHWVGAMYQWHGSKRVIFWCLPDKSPTVPLTGLLVPLLALLSITETPREFGGLPWVFLGQPGPLPVETHTLVQGCGFPRGLAKPPGSNLSQAYITHHHDFMSLRFFLNDYHHCGTTPHHLNDDR